MKKTLFWAFSAIVFIFGARSAHADDLQAQLNSKEGPLTRVIVTTSGTNTLTAPLVIPSNVSLVCSPGTIIEAAPGAFKEAADVPAASLVVLQNVDNVQIYGCTFKMQGAAYYKDPANGYAKSEYRHCVRVTGSRTVTFTDCTFEASGGDGLYIGPEVTPTARIAPAGILARRCIFTGNHRQGMSVVAGSVTVDDSQFLKTAGTSPQSGFDAEPATNGDAVDVLVRRCHSAGNRGPAWMVGLFASNTSSPPSRIVYEAVTYADVPIDQPWLRQGALIRDDSPRGYYHPALPKGTYVEVNGVVLVDKKQ